MYAIFEAKGKQFRAEPEATLRIPSLDAEPGDRVVFDQVLLAESEGRVTVGRPSLDGASVAVEVVRHGRDDKIVVYKMKRRKGYRKKQGHRQGFTEVRVLDIEIGSGATTGRKAGRKKAEAPSTPAAGPPAEAPVAEVAAEAPEAPAKIEATDTARALAEEHGIDLATLEGTGKDGRILKSDVEKAIKQQEGK